MDAFAVLPCPAHPSPLDNAFQRQAVALPTALQLAWNSECNVCTPSANINSFHQSGSILVIIYITRGFWVVQFAGCSTCIMVNSAPASITTLSIVSGEKVRRFKCNQASKIDLQQSEPYGLSSRLTIPYPCSAHKLNILRLTSVSRHSYDPPHRYQSTTTLEVTTHQVGKMCKPSGNFSQGHLVPRPE